MNKLIYSLLAEILFLSACAVGVDSSLDWANSSDEPGGNSNTPIIVLKANVSIPATTSANISKNLNLSKAVSEVPASGYQAVVENFTTGEVVGTSTIESDGSTEVACDEAKAADPDDATKMRLVLKAIPSDGASTDEGVVEKYIESAITADEIAGGAVNITETLSLQMIRAQLGVETSAMSSGEARDALKTGSFRIDCFKDFMSEVISSSSSVDANMSGAFGSMKIGFECIVGGGSKPQDFGYASFPEMFRAMANGELTDAVIDQIGSAISSNNCGGDASAIINKMKDARSSMSAVRQTAATQIAGDEATCTKVSSGTSEMSAWKEAYKSAEPSKLTDYATFITDDGADLKKMIEVARANNDYTAFDSTRAKVTWGAIEAGDYAVMDEDAIKTVLDLVTTADLTNVNVTDYEDVGRACGSVVAEFEDNEIYLDAMQSDPAKYSNYFTTQVNDSNATATTITNIFVSIYNTLEMNSFDACKSANGGVYVSSCFDGYSMTDIDSDTALAVSSTVPISNATNAEITGAIIVTFNKKPLSRSVSATTFTVKKTSDNSAVSGTVSVSDETATFAPSSSLAFGTQYTATITTGVKDVSNVALATAYSWTFITSNAPDSTAPAVASTSPANSASNGGIINVTATFSESMDTATMTGSNFYLSAGGNNVSGSVSYSGAIATFMPSSNLSYGTTYTATITTGAKDVAGNAMAANYSWTFTTSNEPDTTAPTVYSTSPANGATNLGIAINVTATFSESMDQATMIGANFSLSDGNNVSGSVSYSGTTATFTPSSDLSYGTTYTATITTDTKDVAGNAMAANYSWTFTTRGAAGAKDLSFNSTGYNTNAITHIGLWQDIGYAAVILPDGKIVVAGSSFTDPDIFKYDVAIVRYNTDGTLDTTFGTNGITTTALSEIGWDEGYDIARQSDGKLVVVGVAANENLDSAVIRYNSNGTLDATFGTGGIVTTAVNATRDDLFLNIALQSDGKIIASGWTKSGTNIIGSLVRYNTDGTLDTTFDTDGKVTLSSGSGQNTQFSQLAVLSSGKIMITGYTRNGTSAQINFLVALYNSDGSLDSTFGTGGITTTDIYSNNRDMGIALLIQPDEKIISAGTANYTAGSSGDFAAVRYNSNGSLDTSFGTNGIATVSINSFDQIYGAVLQSDGKIVLAGRSKSGAFNYDMAVVRLNSNGTLDTTFDGDGIVTTEINDATDEIIARVYLQSDGKIVGAGYSASDFAIIRYWP